MNKTRELVWSGLSLLNKEHGELLRKKLFDAGAVSAEMFGHYSLQYFPVSGSRFVAIGHEGRWVGCGVVFPDQEAALTGRKDVQKLLEHIRIPGRAGVWKLYTGPVQVE